ncbi:thermonuclease family protein [Actinopolymorpha sp. B17G11]|uniref:thermonuclease family protein n=1 Tax=Actinopolymorpha sp. B17G11 TaxID=3160861 RepID=UPI0032E3B1E3
MGWLATALAVLFVVGGCDDVERTTVSAATTSEPAATTSPTAPDLPEQDLGAACVTPEPTPKDREMAVVAVVDGDTIKVDDDGTVITVRVIGLDTPETKDPRTDVQCYGPQASARAHRLLDGVFVRLESDPRQDLKDKYGRTLAYVWLPDGQLFEEQMIAGGYGQECTYDTPYKYQARFRAAERHAKAARAGLWKACEQSAERTPKPVPKPTPNPAPELDPRFRTCAEANDAGYGPYIRGVDPEYDWYRDADAVICGPDGTAEHLTCALAYVDMYL